MRTITPSRRLTPTPFADLVLDEVQVTAEGEHDFGGGGDDPTTPQPSASTSTGPPTLYGNWIPALFMPHRRSIGGILAEVTIEEQATDDLTITEHPVEQGAPIADHAFKRPPTVTIRAGWSVRGSYDLSAESGVYGLLLSWQASLHPFDVVTGKRRYSNMLMERLTVTTDEKSEYALMADIVCRQVTIVSTQTTSVKSASDAPENQADPSATASGSDSGTQPTRDVGNGGVLETPEETANRQSDVEMGGGDQGVPEDAASRQTDVETGGASSEAQKVEEKAVDNAGGVASVSYGEKNLYDAQGNKTGVSVGIHNIIPPTMMMRGVQALNQRGVRRLAWQQMQRSQRGQAARSQNAPPYMGSHTR